MDAYGLKLISQDEAKGMGLPAPTGMFEELYNQMLETIKRDKYKKADFGDASQMTATEKKISFLNRYFVFKKIREVNTEKVVLELGEFSEIQLEKNKEATTEAVKVAKKSKKKGSLKKLSKQITLEQATNSNEPKKSTKKKKKEIIIIEDDD